MKSTSNSSGADAENIDRVVTGRHNSSPGPSDDNARGRKAGRDNYHFRNRSESRAQAPSSGDWVNPLVLVKKSDDSLRIYEITSKLKDARIFSKLDANQAFYQIPLDEASSNLCTVGTPFGRYKFLRLPYGVKCAPEVFNERFRQIFNMENVAVYIDDIIVCEKSKAEHDRTLEAVLETARKNNVKFNLSK
ncbi:hypothetical protein ILUMI_13085 [Ignelater luminosus]|uniref:Reverse transcriptase domain-containing protein n=1 Tax=Ignelater luminosus TaxID=2038154 RepID=A0A8K0CYE7_IGNLU|nr:hypothetical protein ILUMI_13085 [Ignelater luminosus]